jgi:hypothetical protein
MNGKAKTNTNSTNKMSRFLIFNDSISINRILFFYFLTLFIVFFITIQCKEILLKKTGIQSFTMRKTSMVLIASLMAFGMAAFVPQNTAVAAVGCGACKIGPNYQAASGPYDNNLQVAYSTLGSGGNCQNACQYCKNVITCATCIDKYGCNCYARVGITCKGQPQGWKCDSPT